MTQAMPAATSSPAANAMPAGRASVRRPSLAQRLAARRSAALALILLALMVLAGVLAPVIAPYPPTQMHARDRLVGPSLTYPMGTDESGRDLFSRVLFGARISLLAALAASLLALGLGIPLGIAAGYRGGGTDDILMRILDGFLAIPPILLALTVLTALGPGVTNAIVAIGLLGIPLTARVARAAILVERGKEYVLAARTSGNSDFRLIRRELLPNIVPPVILMTSLLAANAILLEAALSFLGLGVQPPDASWGTLLQLGYGYLAHSIWYVTFPGLAICLAVWSLNVVGDALRDDLDPRLRGV